MNIAVLDTETNWFDEVMSIGIVIADRDTLEEVERRYYIITAAAKVGGLYDSTLYIVENELTEKGTRERIVKLAMDLLEDYGVSEIFAYNACFDYGHLPELQCYHWFDIMRLAAYRQYNSFISDSAECYRTGRLKRGYGVECMLQIMRADNSYLELHNALTDAADELDVMRLLKHPIECYEIGKLNKIKLL